MPEAKLPVRIHHLGVVPEFRSIVADRVWNAWWRPSNQPLAAVEAALDAVLACVDFPSFTLVAVREGTFCGTVTVIERDIEARPDLCPCIAALWVEDAFRGRGIGRSLIDAACQRLARSGFERAWLGARPKMRGYYAGLGWTLADTGVGEGALDVFSRALP